MLKTKPASLTALAIGLALAMSDVARAEVVANSIFGTDSRQDLHQVSDARVLRLADSTVALVQAGAVAGDRLYNSPYSIGSILGVQVRLCSTERFLDQGIAAFCSGSLVGPDLILTAGHCIKDLADCRNTKFVFGFAKKSASQDTTRIKPQDVYGCASIVNRVLVHPAGADFALIKLNRRVTGHQPLAINRTGRIAVGSEVVAIGHPNGLPTKVASGQVLENIYSDFFTTNLDTYQGNSGSAVFNKRTGLIEGVLVRGPGDFDESGDWNYDRARQCLVSQRYASNNAAYGIDVTKIGPFARIIPPVAPIPAPPAPTPVATRTPLPGPNPIPAPAPTPNPVDPPVVLPVEGNGCVKRAWTYEIENIPVPGGMPYDFRDLPETIRTRVSEVVRKLDNGIPTDSTRVSRVASLVARLEAGSEECRGSGGSEDIIQLDVVESGWQKLTGAGIRSSQNRDPRGRIVPGYREVKPNRIYLIKTEYTIE